MDIIFIVIDKVWAHPKSIPGNVRDIVGINWLGVKYLDGIPKEQWTKSYDRVLRYEHMKMNLAECINFILKGTCYLVVTSTVKETYFS